MKHLVLLLLVMLSLRGSALAQSLDPTFQLPMLLNHSANVQVLAMAAQADGKSLVAGDFQFTGSALSNNVIRLNADRSRDPSFRVAPGANGPVSSLAVQADGKALLAGSFTAYAGTATGPVARLLPNGELDTAFQLPAAMVGATISVLAVLADGRVLVGGTASAALPGGLVRLLPSGALDTGFDVGVGAGSGGQVLTLAVQPADGRVIVGGQFTGFGGRASQSLVRLLPTGQPDASFAASGFDGSAVVNSVALYGNGNVLAGGYAKQSSAGAFTGLLTRLLPTGVPDPQFSISFDLASRVARVRVEPDGRAWVVGYFQYVLSNGVSSARERTSVVRLLADGSLDSTFLPPLAQSYNNIFPYYFDVLPQADGQLLLGGRLTESGHYALSLFSAIGVPDPSVDLGLQWRGAVSAAQPLTSGQLLVSGTYTSLNGQAVGGRLQRLNADGSFDQDLTLPLPTDGGVIRNLFPQPDGRVYVFSSTFTCLTGDCLAGGTMRSIYRVYRVTANNTRDASFPPVELNRYTWSFGPSPVGPTVQFMVPYPNGDVLVAGLSGQPVKPLLARYSPTGAAVPGFTPPALPSTGRLDQVLMQPDGSVVVSYHLVDTNESQLVRLLPSGSLDPAFMVGSNPVLPAGSTFRAALALPAGKVLVTGNFTSFGGVAAPTGVVRLTSAGAVDASFQVAASLAPLVPLAVLPDDRLLVRVNSQPGTAHLVRLLADGAVEAAFAPVTMSVAGIATPTWNVVLQPDGKPVLYGDFEAVNGTLRIGLARLSAAAPLASRSTSPASLALSVYPNPAHRSVALEFSTALVPGSDLQLLDNLGREVERQPVSVQTNVLTFSLAGLPPGLYLLRCGAATRRLLVE